MGAISNLIPLIILAIVVGAFAFVGYQVSVIARRSKKQQADMANSTGLPLDQRPGRRRKAQHGKEARQFHKGRHESRRQGNQRRGLRRQNSEVRFPHYLPHCMRSEILTTNNAAYWSTRGTRAPSRHTSRDSGTRRSRHRTRRPLRAGQSRRSQDATHFLFQPQTLAFLISHTLFFSFLSAAASLRLVFYASRTPQLWHLSVCTMLTPGFTCQRDRHRSNTNGSKRTGEHVRFSPTLRWGKCAY